MRTQHARPFSRRRFLREVTLAGTAGLLGVPPRRVAAEPPPETKRLRLVHVPAICVAPEYVAEDLLKGEGFSELQYVKKEGTVAKQQALAAGEVDLTLHFSAPLLTRIDAGDPIVLVTDAIRLLVEGKIDAFLGFPPYPQEVRAQQIGHGGSQ